MEQTTYAMILICQHVNKSAETLLLILHRGAMKICNEENGDREIRDLSNKTVGL